MRVLKVVVAVVLALIGALAGLSNILGYLRVDPKNIPSITGWPLRGLILGILFMLGAVGLAVYSLVLATRSVSQLKKQQAEEAALNAQKVDGLRLANDGLVKRIATHQDEIAEIANRREREVKQLQTALHAAQPPKSTGLMIHRATLGSSPLTERDVTERLQGFCSDSLDLIISYQALLGPDPLKDDPAPGEPKTLVVTYSFRGGRQITTRRPDSTRLILPEDPWLLNEMHKLETASRKESDIQKIQREELDRLNTELRQVQAKRTQGLQMLKDAPRFVVKCPKDGNMLILTNDGPNAAVGVEVGALLHLERHAISAIYAPFGTIPSKQTEERKITVAQRQPNSGGALWSAMRDVAMEPDPVDTVILTFKNLSGTEFLQRFILTSQVDGSVTWHPEPVQLQELPLDT